MAQLIAGIYEIEQAIGSGGGGIVYLGRHTRLQKPVVLKADKRKLTTGADALRREVDLLKELNHTYIPQVYDFVEENGTVYTVMDFIEGESLDKLIKRGQIPSQPELIKWACQLLEALNYLHSRPPHGILHGDIKPANIMLRPNGDICLIDFNIALALGEDGAVKVGFSRGYASPEHYGVEYVGGRAAQTQTGAAHGPQGSTALPGTGSVMQPAGTAAVGTETENTEDTEGETVKLDNAGSEDETVKLGAEQLEEATEKVSGTPANAYWSRGQAVTGQSSMTTPAVVRLDARSDIYSLGATLYHLISGRRPAERAEDVEPLGADVCSPAVSRILRKAMDPAREKRYQTAEEMLRAFLGLHRNDVRVKRHRRRAAVTAALLGCMFLAGGAATFVGLKQMEQRQNALALAGNAEEALRAGDVSSAVGLALQAIPVGDSILNAPVTAEAQKALTDALGVYDLGDHFQALDALKLPAAPFKIVRSPEGTRFSVLYAYEAAVFDAATQEKIAVLPSQESALSDLLFIGEDEVLYAGAEGLTRYDLASQKKVWTGMPATTVTLSGDGRIAAAVNRDAETFEIYDAATGELLQERSYGGKHLSVAYNDIFADPCDNIFRLNADGTLLGLSFSDGGLMVANLQAEDEDVILFDDSEYTHFEGGFTEKYFLFAASGDTSSLFYIVDPDPEAPSVVGGYESEKPIHMEISGEDVYLAEGNLLVKLDLTTQQEKELAHTGDQQINAFSIGDAYTLVTADDRSFRFYDKGARLSATESGERNFDFCTLAGHLAVLGSRDENNLRVLSLEDHSSAELLHYDAAYAHDEARLSPDGKKIMLFSIFGFRIIDINGTLISDIQLPDSDRIYDQQYRREDGSAYLEVIWYDGTVRKYDAGDGHLLSETKGEEPDRSLHEEFETDRYRISSDLHGAPVVYEKESGKQAAILPKDDYLTYVTEVPGGYITQYAATDGTKYGLFMNESWETLARLPGLCDVADGKLIFDFASGDIRQSRILSLAELVSLGESRQAAQA